MTEETREETGVTQPTAMAVIEKRELDLIDVQQQMEVVNTMMQKLMRKGVHYGLIPGCGDKPTLLKSGAEMLGYRFRLYAEYEIERIDMENGHREYDVTCVLRHIGSDQKVGEGVATCSTMESKYRYRKAERTCPSCGKQAIIKGKAEYGGGWLCFKKKDGCGQKYLDNDASIVSQPQGRVENEDLADSWNTVKKIGKKRAFVDAILSSTAASEYFTQDIEDMFNNGVDTIDITPQVVEPDGVPIATTRKGTIEDQIAEDMATEAEHAAELARDDEPRQPVAELPADQKVEVEELLEGPVATEPEPSQPAEPTPEAPQAPKKTKDYGNSEPLPEELCAKICERFLDVPLVDKDKKPTGEKASLTQKELEAIMRKPAHEWEGRHGKHLNRLFQAVKHGADLDAVRSKRYMRDFDDSALT